MIVGCKSVNSAIIEMREGLAALRVLKIIYLLPNSKFWTIWNNRKRWKDSKKKFHFLFFHILNSVTNENADPTNYQLSIVYSHKYLHKANRSHFDGIKALQPNAKLYGGLTNIITESRYRPANWLSFLLT